MRELKPEEGLRIFDIKWCTNTAGPSPNNNERIEVFLLGCNKAMQGNPCKGCFNSITWDKNKAEYSWDPIELADMINEKCDPNNKYITIGGGEPTDQIENLIPLTKRLKEHGFHIIMYTWRELKDILKMDGMNENGAFIKHELNKPFKELLKNLDILIDGQFILEERTYQQELGDGMLNSIGSANQIVWDIKLTNDNKNKNLIPTYFGYKLEELAGLYIKPDTNDLIYITKE